MKNKFLAYSYWQLKLFFLLSLLLDISCTNIHRNNIIESGITIEDAIHRKPPSSFSDTITIDFPAAVIFSPDSIQLEKIKTVTDREIFESAVHDCYYQIRNSRIVLQKYFPHIKIIEVRNVRYLFFKKLYGENEWIDLNNKNDQCGIFVFDRLKSAHLVDMTNIDSELGFYFK